LNEKGYNNAVLIPIAFTSDHIETLFELDATYVAEAQKLGMKVRRAKALNDEPLFIQALADVVVKHIKDGKKSTQQLHLRCPMCTNEACGESKAMFALQP
jgi:protoporphyrin/coproporphyrin ferrochelatase